MAEEDLKEKEELDVLDEVWDDRALWNDGEEGRDTPTELDRWDDVVKDLVQDTGPRPQDESVHPQPVVDLKTVKPKAKPLLAPLQTVDPERGPAAAVSDKQLLMLIQKYKAAEKICEITRMNLQTLQQRVAHLSYRIKRYIEVEGLYRDTGPIKMTLEGILIPKGHLVDTGFKAGDQFNVAFKDHHIILVRQRRL